MLHARRAQREQLAAKIGQPEMALYADRAAGAKNDYFEPSPMKRGDPRGAGGAPSTPPGGRSGPPASLFPPLDRANDYYYDSKQPPLPSAAEQLNNHRQQQQRQLAPTEPAPSDGVARYGRRARTVETDDRDRSRQERLAQYQRELKEQVDAEAARKQAAAAERKREEMELDIKVRRQNEDRARREKEDMDRERRDVEERSAAAMGGKPRAKRDPNAATSAVAAGGDDAKFGRRAAAGAASGKTAEYMAELEKQAQEVRQRKEAEAARAQREEREFDQRMDRWAASDGPLGMGQAKQQHSGAQQPYGGGGPPSSNNNRFAMPPGAGPGGYNGGDQPQFGNMNVRASTEDRLPSVLASNEFGGGAPISGRGDAMGYGGGGGAGFMQPPSNPFGGPPTMPPMGMPHAVSFAPQQQQPPSYHSPAPYGVGGPYSAGGAVPAGSTEVAMLRDEILHLLQHQSRAIDDLAYRQPLPHHVTVPLAFPTPLVAAPPAHRGYGAQLAAQPGVVSYGPGVETRRTMAAMGDAQQMLDRFLREDETRPHQSLYPDLHHGGAEQHHQQLQIAGNPQDVGRSQQLTYESKFVPKEDYLSSNIELDSEPAQFILPSKESARR